tara:strand:+ start:714 stop:872 length:159 start_codon:yes stop_codon:yes gene_type:complete
MDNMSQGSRNPLSPGRHKNIKFSDKMDEWSILARLQDYEAEKKQNAEKEKLR